MTGPMAPETSPPPIGPVPENQVRPLWSVMIPTFNCARFLGQTLDSVLAQDPGPAFMQIEVVDDCSTADDPGAVVRELGKGRVTFHRKEKNEGAIANFNTCVRRSHGRLVHILHGDDYVLPGFYERIQTAASRYPEAALIGTRAFFMNEAGHYMAVSPLVPDLEVPGRNARAFHFGTPVQFAGMVVRRDFYEANGGFVPALVHTADWEMWSRAVSVGGGIIMPDVLAAYRVFATNDTGRLMRTGENLRDRERLIQILEQRDPQFDRAEASRRLVLDALAQSDRFAQLQDRDASRASLRFWEERATLKDRASWLARRVARRLGLT
jgi:glycosyltransferase involved in cell wall biosynthesis